MEENTYYSSYTGEEIDGAIREVIENSDNWDNKLSTEGGTMIGPLILDNDPSEDMEAATKKYVDNSITKAILDSWEASY